MADTDIDDIKKQKKAERNKLYYLKRKMELQWDIYMIRYFYRKIEIIRAFFFPSPYKCLLA